ncbi:MAG: hypothetical protein JWL72_2566 [Ilumatobacteraceae bacterium]|nr:hypothetical protein [Ilumatobacteraceae bacterium]MCU1389228.1 hypothetical protein [Ilumatobacteraceae bacterium]
MTDASSDPGANDSAVLDAFVRLSDTLVDDYDVIEFLGYLTERCVELAPVDEASVMLASPTGHLQAVASSSERSRLLELFELQNEDGPCLDAYRTGALIVGADLELERDRWPIFVPEALSVGFRSVVSVPLRLRDRVIGALNLMRSGVGEMDERNVRMVRALTDIATIGVLQQRIIIETQTTAAALQGALDSRVRIEQAKGVLAERTGITVDDAFVLLRAYARRNRLRLTDVAIGVVNRTIQFDDEVPDPS